MTEQTKIPMDQLNKSLDDLYGEAGLINLATPRMKIMFEAARIYARSIADLEILRAELDDVNFDKNTRPVKTDESIVEQIMNIFTDHLHDTGRLATSADEWQPIETAPKDGTEVIVVRSGFKVTVGWFDKKSGWTNPTRAISEDYDQEMGGYEPTHWMPLPKPPIAKAHEV